MNRRTISSQTPPPVYAGTETTASVTNTTMEGSSTQCTNGGKRKRYDEVELSQNGTTCIVGEYPTPEVTLTRMVSAVSQQLSSSLTNIGSKEHEQEQRAVFMNQDRGSVTSKFRTKRYESTEVAVSIFNFPISKVF